MVRRPWTLLLAVVVVVELAWLLIWIGDPRILLQFVS
jgi:hypothetical protein